MNIHKALKVKNRLIGEVTRLRDILKRENSRRSDSQSTVDCQLVANDLVQNFTNLVKIKASISRASAEVADKLVEMAELKGFLNFLRSLPTRRGSEIVFVGRDQEKLEYQWTAYISLEEVDSRCKKVELRINQLQDEVDVFNATTSVDY